MKQERIIKRCILQLKDCDSKRRKKTTEGKKEEQQVRRNKDRKGKNFIVNGEVLGVSSVSIVSFCLAASFFEIRISFRCYPVIY